MKEKTILNKVKALLGLEVKLEQMKLADGVTVIQADMFEPEAEVMIVTTDEQMIPLPIGEYELEDGRMLIVTVEGVIAEIKEPMAEEETTQEQPVAEVPVEASKEPTPSAKKVVETTTKEMHFSAEEKAELEDKVKSLELKLAELEAKPITFNPEPKVVVNLADMTPLERHRYIKSRMN